MLTLLLLFSLILPHLSTLFVSPRHLFKLTSSCPCHFASSVDQTTPLHYTGRLCYFFFFFASSLPSPRGSLLLGLQISENWTQLAYHAFNSSDWQITPLTDWRFVLVFVEILFISFLSDMHYCWILHLQWRHATSLSHLQDLSPSLHLLVHLPLPPPSLFNAMVD